MAAEISEADSDFVREDSQLYAFKPLERIGNIQQQKVLSLNFMNRLMMLIEEYIQSKRADKRRSSANDELNDLEQILERIQYTDESIAELRL